MIQSKEDIIFNACKNKVGFYRSQKFKDWFHKKYPDKEMHHLFGSYTAIKTTDFCSVPVEKKHSTSKAETDKSQFAIDSLPLLLEVMIAYILYLESENSILEKRPKIKEIEWK